MLRARHRKAVYHNSRAHLLVISHVYPFPGAAGQQQRVRAKLKAFRELFDVTFLTIAENTQLSNVQKGLLEYCDEAIVLPSRYRQSQLHRVLYRTAGIPYCAYTGLKFSNYRIGKLEFPPARIARAVPDMTRYDCVVYEYWHAVDSVSVFQANAIACVLDMHDILWKSYERQLGSSSRLPGIWRKHALARYRTQEVAAWRRFDALLAINDAEYQHVVEMFPGKTVFNAPMGVDLQLWPYSWAPTTPPRIAYYGALANPYNQQEALRCYRQIMPRIWEVCPQAEFWIIGSNPPDYLKALPGVDSRVHVPGFVEEIQSLLKTVTVVVCPFEAQFGFRSRLIEVMALGVPVAATPDAVYGMNMNDGHGLFLADTDDALAQYCLRLIGQPDWAQQQSRMARRQVEERFGFDTTYGQLARDLYEFAVQYASRK